MRNLICFIACIFVCGAVCDVHAAAVVDRQSCLEISAQIDELATATDPDDVAQLNELRDQYRRQCMKSSAGRRVRGVTTESVDVVRDTVSDAENDDDVTVVTVDTIADVAPAPSADQVAQWLADGLCPDGAAPNRFGCCAGERFTDMGNLVFACCPDDGGECFPPIEKGDL